MFIMVQTNESIDRNKVKKGDNGERIKETKVLANQRAIARLTKHFPDLEVGELVCGDIMVILDSGQTLAIERKRPGDFLGSIGNGRIFRQAEQMANKATWSCIVLEGAISFNEEDKAVIPVYNNRDVATGAKVTEWRGVSVRGAIFALMWSGCPIIITDPLRLPETIMELVRFCSKPAEHAQSLGRRRIVTFPPISLAEEIISAFPNVGLKRAKSLLEFARGKNATDTAVLGEALSWASIFPMIDSKARPEGWGNKTVENVRGFLGLQMGEYLTVQEDKKQVAERERLKKFPPKATPAKAKEKVNGKKPSKMR